jgi:hypothetical protein
MKSIGKLIIILAVLFAGIIVGRLIHTSSQPPIKSFEEIQPATKQARIQIQPTRELWEQDPVVEGGHWKPRGEVEVSPQTTNHLKDSADDKTQEIKLQQRLQEVEAEVAKRRETIICDYGRREADFRNDAQARMAQLAAQEDAAKAKLEQGLTNTQTKVSGGDVGGYLDGHIDQFGNVDGYISGLQSERQVTTTVIGNPSAEYENERKRIAKAKTDTSEDLQFTLAHLNAQKQYDLDELEKLRQLWIAGAVAGNYTSTSEADVSTSSPSHLPITITPKTNIITGIVFSGDEGSTVLINGEIVHKGGYIGDIKVVSISEKEAEFEKNGKRWTQRISEPPNPAWQE